MKRAGRWLVGSIPLIVITAVITLVINHYGEDLIESFDDPPDRSAASIADLERKLAAESRHPAVIREANLRGTPEGRGTRFVVVRHNTVGTVQPGVDVARVSDDLRVYERSAGRLRLRFSFQPRANSRVGIPAFIFTLRTIRDLDGDGGHEIVGAFYSFGMAPVRPRPVLISWDTATSTYRLLPLTPFEPELSASPKPGLYASGIRRDYLSGTRLSDAALQVGIQAFHVEEFAVVKDPVAVLLLAYVHRAKSHAEVPELEIHARRITNRGGAPYTTPCSFRARVRARVDTPAEADRALGAAWRTHRPRDIEKACPTTP